MYGLPKIKIPSVSNVVSGARRGVGDLADAGRSAGRTVVTTTADYNKQRKDRAFRRNENIKDVLGGAASTVRDVVTNPDVISGAKWAAGEASDAAKYTVGKTVDAAEYTVGGVAGAGRDTAGWLGGQFDTIKWFPIIALAGVGLLLYGSRKEIASTAQSLR